MGRFVNLLVVRVVRRDADEHFVEEDAEKVPINGLAVALPSEHLRSEVSGRSAETTSLSIVHHAYFREAEISQQSVTVLVIDNVVRLQVPENDVSTVQVLKGKQDFSKVDPCPVLSEALIFLECSAHVAAWCVVKKEEQLLRGLEGVLKTDNERVPRVSQHVSFRLCVLYEVLAENLLLVQDLHREELPSFLRLR